jgi:hypothetical protein
MHIGNSYTLWGWTKSQPVNQFKANRVKIAGIDQIGD